MKGIQIFVNKGCDTAYKEMNHMHQRASFEPIDSSMITRREKNIKY